MGRWQRIMHNHKNSSYRKTAFAKRLTSAGIWVSLIGVAAMIGTVGMAGVQRVAPSEAFARHWPNRLTERTESLGVIYLGAILFVAGLLVCSVAKAIEPRDPSAGSR